MNTETNTPGQLPLRDGEQLICQGRPGQLSAPKTKRIAATAAGLLLGIGSGMASICVNNILIASLLGVFAFSSFWSIKEIFEQEERVKKGWFPKNPKRTYKF